MTKLHEAVAAYQAAFAARCAADDAFSAACAAASADCGGEFYGDDGVGVLWSPSIDEKEATPFFFEQCSMTHGRCPARVKKAAEDHGLAAAFELTAELLYAEDAAERHMLETPCNSRADKLAKFGALDPHNYLEVDAVWEKI